VVHSLGRPCHPKTIKEIFAPHGVLGPDGRRPARLLHDTARLHAFTQTEGIGTLTTLFFRSLDLAKHRAGLSAADYQAQQNQLFAQARGAVEEG